MAVGDRTETRLLGPSVLPTTAGLLGSAVAANRVWVTKQITICNTSGVDALVYLAVDPTGVSISNSHYFMWALPIAASDTMVLDTGIVMVTGDQFYGYADRTGVNIIVNGWIKEV